MRDCDCDARSNDGRQHSGGATLCAKGARARGRNSYDEGGESGTPISTAAKCTAAEHTETSLCPLAHASRTHVCPSCVQEHPPAAAASIIYTLLPSTRPRYLLTVLAGCTWFKAVQLGLALSLPWATRLCQRVQRPLAAVQWHRPARHGTTGATPEVSADVA